VGNTAAPDAAPDDESDSNSASDVSDSNIIASDDSNDDSDNSTPLTTYVDALEAELDAEIADLDNIHDPVATNDASIDPDQLQQSAREQTAADLDTPAGHNSDDDDDSAYNDNQPTTEPRPHLRQRRAPSYAHLKGRDGDGSLPTVARPHAFGGGKHQAHIILQSIVMTQYNLKQGIQKFGDKGKEAVMTELQQLHCTMR
jgi:hypothetical protein